MMNIIVTILVSLFTISELSAQLQLFELDKGHSYIQFSVGYLGMMHQRGQFDQFDASMVYDRSDASKTSVTLNIESKSINTNHDFRDNHLRSPDFLDVERYPLIRFERTELERHNGQLTVIGNLILHGFSKELKIPFRTTGLIVDWEGKERIGFEGEVSINRRDFGILGDNKFNPRFVKDRIISDTVRINFSLQGVVKNTTNWKPSVDILNRIKENGFDQVFARFQKVLGGQKEEALKQIVIFYTATNSMIYDVEHIDNAITILNTLEKSKLTDKTTLRGVHRKLIVAYFIKGDTLNASIYLDKLEDKYPESPFVSEMGKILKD